MEDLVRHLVAPIVDHPEDIVLSTVDGESVVMIELKVHDDDREAVEGERGRTLRSIRNILSAAAGSKKASLDLVDENASGAEE
ncbi:MAG: KH domain-containing protein [Alphaproteobacteria bacterium]|nr:KH domain-containing protein [Phycisphaerales bacterium]MCB9674331.1 KH domain-containing protein [Alphaproteobacteria bacterium]